MVPCACLVECIRDTDFREKNLELTSTRTPLTVRLAPQLMPTGTLTAALVIFSSIRSPEGTGIWRRHPNLRPTQVISLTSHRMR